MIRIVNIVTGVVFFAALLGCISPNDSVSIKTLVSSAEEPTYFIEGREVQLNSADGSTALLMAVRGDLNADGREDLAAIVLHNSEGSGVFTYLNVFLADEDRGWQLIKEAFLGDRVRFDRLDIYAEKSVSPATGVPIHSDDYGMLAVAYFIHTDTQSFVEEPALYITQHWRVLDEKLIKVEDY